MDRSLLIPAASIALLAVVCLIWWLRSSAAEKQAEFDLSLLHDVHAPIVAVKQCGEISFYNKACEGLFGYGPEEVVGRHLRFLLEGPGQAEGRGPLAGTEEQDFQVLLSLFQSQDICCAGLRGVRQDQSSFPLRVSIARSTVRGGENFILSLNDVSELRSLEEQLSRSQKLSAVGRLTGGIAHDFNNLLAVIIGNADLLDYHLAERGFSGLRELDAILEVAGKGTQLTEKLLDFVRHKPLEVQEVEITPFMSDMQLLLTSALRESIDFSVNIAPGLPPVTVDRSALENALINLVFNSRDAIRCEGRVVLSADLKHVQAEDPQAAAGLRPGSYMVFEVRDTGEGMTEEQKLRAFEAFYTTKSAGKGTGLGLAMVDRFAKSMGGKTTIDSRCGEGTRVRIYLPVRGEIKAERTVSARQAVEMDGSPA